MVCVQELYLHRNVFANSFPRNGPTCHDMFHTIFMWYRTFLLTFYSFVYTLTIIDLSSLVFIVRETSHTGRPCIAIPQHWILATLPAVMCIISHSVCNLNHAWRVLCSGIWCLVVVHWKSTDVLEKYVASIFRAEEWAKQETNMKADGMFLCNVGCLSMDYMVLHPRR
jgi:hypothetical protein